MDVSDENLPMPDGFDTWPPVLQERVRSHLLSLDKIGRMAYMVARKMLLDGVFDPVRMNGFIEYHKNLVETRHGVKLPDEFKLMAIERQLHIDSCLALLPDDELEEFRRLGAKQNLHERFPFELP